MDIKRTIESYFAGQKDVVCVYLFGSAARGKENKFSDLDIAVYFDRRLSSQQYSQRKLSMIDELSRLFDREIDVIVLNEASSFLKFQIIKDGQRVYEKPERKEHGFEAGTLIEYFDFLPIRRRLEEALLNNIREA